MNIYVGNLPYNMTGDELRAIFETYGGVTDSSVIIDRVTNRSRGFGFVEMSDEAEARKAIEETNGADYKGRTLVVNEARPREERPRNGGGFRPSYGGGGGGNGGGGGDRNSRRPPRY